jgi:formate hydrogenlyase subunit 6/NADH:ubiquinone oxidoreductase subunit I
MTIKEEFLDIFNVPPAMHPYISLVVEKREMELIVGIKDQAVTVEQVAKMFHLTQKEAEEFLFRSYQREVINKKTKDSLTTYTAKTFYHRFDNYAMWENWGDFPSEVRDEVIEWSLQEYIKLWKPVVEEAIKDPEVYRRIPNPDVMLLEEILEMVDAAEDHLVLPCDCRKIVMACNKPVDVCIRLDEGARLTLERGYGKRISKEECKALVVHANRRGLIHTGRKSWRKDGLFGFCNCCACDCYPFRGSMAIGMEKQWPISHHLAVRDLEKCTHCGLCSRRCYFNAYYYNDSEIIIDGKTRKAVKFDSEKCWGCGICSTACPSGAINMTPLN